MARNLLTQIGVQELNFDNPTAEETAQHQSAADEILLQNRLEDIAASQKATEMKLKYQLFRQAVESKGISLNPYEQTDVKRNLLETHFPGKFSHSNQDLRQQTIAQVGRIFNKLSDMPKAILLKNN